MAEIELAPLSHRLDEDEVRTLTRLLAEAGAPAFDKTDEHASHTIAARISEEALTEFLDRLDAHDLGAEIYVPVEFEGRVVVGDFRVASSQALLDTLEEMREELNVDAGRRRRGRRGRRRGRGGGRRDRDRGAAASDLAPGRRRRDRVHREAPAAAPADVA
jgi:hypothetical protein